MPTYPPVNIQRAGLESTFSGGMGIYMPMPGENYGTWVERIKKIGFANNPYGPPKQYLTPEFFQKIRVLAGWDNQGNSEPQGIQANTNNGSTINRNSEVDAFYRMMMDPNAPELRAAQEHASNLAQRGAAGRGIRGGLSDAGIRKAGLDARMGLASQRADLGLRALQGGMNYDLGMGTQAIQRQGQQFDQDQSNYINRANEDRAKWQMVTTAGGQLVSGLTEAAKSYYTGGGSSGIQNNMGGAGSYNTQSGYYGSNPSDWSNPYGGY